MFCRLVVCFLAAVLLRADDHWTGLKSGSFEVLSNTGDKPAREALMFLEQLRETLRIITGKEEMRMVWPVRVLVFKRMPGASANFALGRDARMLAISESGSFSRESVKELARILLYENTTRLPQEIETGLIELVSTLEVNGTRVTLGAPVPETERSHGWALMQLVTTDPNYAGRSRVMVSNLEHSGDLEAACHNAFEKTAKQINDQADAYLKAGNFGTTLVSARALSPVRDFKVMQLDPDDGKIAVADLLLAAGSGQAEAAYTPLHGAQAAEGLGLMAVKEHKDNQARSLLQSAIESKSESARAWLELGRLEPDAAKAVKDLKKSSELNPRWAEPYLRMAERQEDLAQKAELLKKAAALDARNIDCWQLLAKTETAAKDYPAAQKAWAGAERAAATEEERARIHQVRLDAEQERADFEAAEKKRIAEEREQDIQRVKGQSDAAIHAAEEAASKRLNPDGKALPKPEGWYEAMQNGDATVEGVLARLDCLGQQAKLVIQTSDGKTVQLLVGDPSQIAIAGGGEKALACGAQKSQRKVTVQYKAKPNAKLKTAGVATTIEFR
ncbi:MAG TPA: hypothetical protein VGP62_28210 [Bryobacteraceae bacterium]|nr:hypothetical protein [Bryobacteraceae bacterium]